MLMLREEVDTGHIEGDAVNGKGDLRLKYRGEKIAAHPLHALLFQLTIIA